MFLNLLKRADFRNFFFSEIIFAFGVGMGTVGANWYLMEQTNSITAVGVMLALNVIAGFLTSPIIGILTDKFKRKQIILFTYFTQSVLIFVIALLLFTRGFHIELLYLFSIVNGIGWTTYMSTSRSLLQELLSSDDLIDGNSLIEICLQVGMFTAGGISGVFYQYLGFENMLIFNAFIFLLSSIFISRVKYNSIIKSTEESFYSSFKSGITYLMNKPKIFFFGVAAIIPLVATMMYNVVLPGYVNDTLQGSSIAFGLSDMFYGVGGFLSGFIAGSLAKKITKNVAITLLFLVSICILIGFSINNYVMLLFLGSLVFGLCNSSLRIVMNTVLMETVPKAFMGRAMSIWMSISLLLQAIASPSLGLLIDSYSPRIGFISLGLLMIIGVVIHQILVILSPSVKPIESKEVGM
ncbi:MFS transporter [Salicibibacter cibi]|uniref:MFS transporter n=1 Tax=Salicibibacter cibi TaxID=2743001 RepID=A0A7T7CFL1_9BACI|nr:MFS transporter [Salicibibacter cibi]QQK80209.1 MFS transporter [Salicibibacter cibi]